DDMLRAKYHALADPIVGLERALFIAQRVDELAAESAALPSLLDQILEGAEADPPHAPPTRRRDSSECRIRDSASPKDCA
ncbi:MAG: hypothetical protein M3Z31_09835, partial [Pseudomonadota bacterium]|nr:hypothetical protein [Pseudomonadota bacterium]